MRDMFNEFDSGAVSQKWVREFKKKEAKAKNKPGESVSSTLVK